MEDKVMEDKGMSNKKGLILNGQTYVTNTQALVCFILFLILLGLSGFRIPQKQNTQDEPRFNNKNVDSKLILPKITELKPAYRDYLKTVDLLKTWEKEANDFVEVGTYGKTTKGLDQYYVKITNKKKQGKKPSCVITGCIHGNEPISTCTEIWWMTHLLNNYEKDSKVKEIIDTREIYFIPVLSPDTYPHSRHVDGVDPNRNFPSSGEKTSVTPVENFKNFFKNKKFDAFVTGHSYGRIFLFAQDNDSERQSAYNRIKKEMDKISSYRASNLGGPNTTLDGDWGNRQGAFSLLVEFGTHQRIPSIEDIQTDFDATYESILYFLKEAPIAFAKKCGRAEIEEKFKIDSSFKDVTNFIESNKKKIMEKINVSLIEDFGNGKIKLKRQNNRGKFVWIAKESINKNSDSFYYTCELVESIEGNIQEMNSKITISKNGDACDLRALLSISVEDIGSKDLKIDMKMKCRRIKNMLIEELD